MKKVKLTGEKKEAKSMNYIGVSICLFDKSMKFHKITADFKPTTETVGLSGICYWNTDAKKAIEKAMFLIGEGFEPESEEYFSFLKKKINL
jgi:hypothetical protein